MSDNWIIVFPAKPDFVPAEAARQRALAYLKQQVPDAEKVVVEVTDKTQFIDCGGNFERILCPTCRHELSISWWHERMDEEYAEDYPMRQHEVPCCRATWTLNDLVYEWPQGFARFTVEAMNPGICNLSEGAMLEFERILGTKVQKVLRHL
jgi:hypothetical protein